MIIIFVPIRIKVALGYENAAITTNCYQVELIVGGRAKLVKLVRRHQAAVSGMSVCNPHASILV